MTKKMTCSAELKDNRVLYILGLLGQSDFVGNFEPAVLESCLFYEDSLAYQYIQQIKVMYGCRLTDCGKILNHCKQRAGKKNY